jgi:hypothetical protein
MSALRILLVSFLLAVSAILHFFGSVSYSNTQAARATTPSQSTERASSGSKVPRQASQRSCDVNATVFNFAGQIKAATSGEVVCLDAGDYGTWTGTDKPLTITSRERTAVTMEINFTTGSGNFTIDSLTIRGGRITNGAKNLIIRNSTFTGSLVFDAVSEANILLDNNTHINIDSCSACSPAAIHLAWSSETFSGITVQNSLFQGGNADGIQAGTGLNILNNRFIRIRDDHGDPTLHTDSIQLIGAKGAIVRGNYLYDNDDGIVAYDGVDSVTIEDNVIDLVRGRFGIELYSDRNSIVRHNTLKFGTACAFRTLCGQIILSRKPSQPAGAGTVVEENVASEIGVSNGSKAVSIKNNMLRFGIRDRNFFGIPVFLGGADPASFDGFQLAPGSPGKNAAADGTDIGVRIHP